MASPDYAGGVVCDVAALVAIVGDLAERRKDSPGIQLYEHARATGLTLAVPSLVVGKAATLHLDARSRHLLGALLAPQLYRSVDDPLRMTGPRGMWWVVEARPTRIPEYSRMLGRCGDPVRAFVAAYAAVTGWPVATDAPEAYASLLGRDDGWVLPTPSVGEE